MEGPLSRHYINVLYILMHCMWDLDIVVCIPETFLLPCQDGLFHCSLSQRIGAKLYLHFVYKPMQHSNTGVQSSIMLMQS